MMVVSEIGEIWSPQTAPARTAATEMIIMVGSSSANMLTTMGTKIAKVPQLVPEEKANPYLSSDLLWLDFLPGGEYGEWNGGIVADIPAF